ncbi:TIGR02117 family protein [Luteolibacter yonseiensis]|uniref:TIGR02117 family protein n=1 Tax=Luteolibacter yonseiensis TaxID=1144680 RepID=A0A934R4R8_9BACT|nr:TIGR02117 family protein [Luteolibacter yonseiensis]MBK1816914.1 TIGR02117 family protein [Luteolibacter yonseiensis]
MKSQPVTALGIFLGIFLAVACLTACSPHPAAIPYTGRTDGPKTVTAYVASHGWHTSLIVPAADLNRRIPALKARFGKPACYEIGWGDEGFYQAKTVTTGLALHAAFFSSGSVVHISAVPDSPYLSFPHSRISALRMSQDQLDNMACFISASMAHDDRVQVISPGKGLYGDSRFYLGTGRYSIVNTCNNWTARGLRSAGLEISSWSKFSSKSVMRALEKPPILAAAPTPAPSP